MEKLKIAGDFLHDLTAAVLMGLAAAGGLAAVLLVVGLLAAGGQLRAALVTVRGGLLIVGALGLFICAGLLLWPRGNAKIRDSARWQRRFRLFGLFPAVFFIDAVILAMAAVIDYYLYF